jgi:hypothetical protein
MLKLQIQQRLAFAPHQISLRVLAAAEQAFIFQPAG